MPDWLEEPAWWVVILATAVASAVVTVLVQRAPPVLFRWVRSGLRWVNYGREVVGLARESSRVSSRGRALSRWSAAPGWVLRSTLFRWFAADPQTWWGYLKGNYRLDLSRRVVFGR